VSRSGEKLFRVLPRQVDQTLATALREWLPGKSWSEVRQLLKSRRVMLSGNLCVDPAYRLRLVDVVKLLPHSLAPPAREEDVRIRHLDQHIVVVEKPAGMTSTREADERSLPPRQRQLRPTLDEVLPRLIAEEECRRRKRGTGTSPQRSQQRAARRGSEPVPVFRRRGGLRRVRPVHRLDRETSGLMVFARTAEAKKHLEHQFRVHSVRRRYLAIAQGDVAAQTIESRLARDRGDGRRGSTKLPDAGKHAVTHVRPIERLGDYTLVECRLETGRTHQIRIHLAEAGHPLCGEKVYGQPLFRPRQPDQSGAPRLALCAVELGFVHPVSGEAMHFEMPLSDDLAKFANRLRKAKPSKGDDATGQLR
jgi:23S rRNA pseudouridine1911/1915/1917 synthase